MTHLTGPPIFDWMPDQIVPRESRSDENADFMPFLNEAIFPLIVEKIDVTLSRTVFHNPLHVPVIDVRRLVTLSLKTFHAPVNAFFSPDQKVFHLSRTVFHRVFQMATTPFFRSVKICFVFDHKPVKYPMIAF